MSLTPIRRKPSAPTHSGGRIERLLVGAAEVSVTHPRSAVAIIALLSVIGLSGASRLHFSHDFLGWFNEDHLIRTGTELMDEVLGGTWVHPRGQALLLKARAEGQPHYVAARYRLRLNRRYGPWQQIVLTDQGQGIHERLVDTSAEAMEVYFETEDASTPREEIVLSAPPAVHRAALSVTPPSYAASWFPPTEAQLGTGLDDLRRGSEQCRYHRGYGPLFTYGREEPLLVEFPFWCQSWTD